MKILHTVEFYPPSVGGMQEVVKQLSERLVKLGHEVTVATTRLPERTAKIINGVRIVEFSVSGNAVRGLNGETAHYRNFLLNAECDIIANFAAQQWATDIMLPILDRIKAKKVFVPTGFSGLYMPEYKDYFTSMKSWFKKYDMNVFLSDDYRDIHFARECGITRTALIPNGAGANEFQARPAVDIRHELGIPAGHFLILHVGSHTGLKGHAEALQIFRQAEINNATFLLIANTFGGGGCTRHCTATAAAYNSSPPAALARKKIIVAELPRKTTIAAYHAADLFLFPSNLECSPLVLFEAMASKTPFLTTDAGNAGEIVAWSGGGLLLPTEIDYKEYVYSRADIIGSVRLLEDLFNDAGKREAMQENGFAAWQQSFTWEKITRDYEKLYLGLLED
ncbi:MAG: glycosyltransferase family 4 protein [Bacillota bacterium]